LPGPPTPKNLKHADRKRSAALDAIKEGKFSFKAYFPDSKRAAQEQERIAGNGLALGTALDKAVALVSVSKETHATYLREVAFWKRELDKDTDVAKITMPQVQEVLKKRGVSRKRMSNVLIPLRAALDYAVNERKIPLNVLDALKVGRIRRVNFDDADQRGTERADPFLISEVATLATAERTGAYWKLCAYTGLRGEELSALKWSDISAAGILVQRAVRNGRYKGPKTKAGRRLVEISPPAQAALDAIRVLNGHREFVIINPNTDEPFTGDRPLRRCFQHDCLVLGVKYKQPKFLRHSFASWYLEAGESPLWVASQLGHATVEEVQRTYARHIPKNTDVHGSRFLLALKAGRDLGTGAESHAEK
jgi:integrase